MFYRISGTRVSGGVMRVGRRTIGIETTLAAAAAAMLLVGCKSDGAMSDRFAAAAPAHSSYQVAMPVPAARPQPRPPQALQATLTALTAQFGGRVGIAVQSVNEGWTAQSHGNLYLPQQSVSKLWVAMTMLDAVDRGQLRLSDPISVTRADLTVFHQPIAAARVQAGGFGVQNDLARHDRLMAPFAAPNQALRRGGLQPGALTASSTAWT